MTLIFILLCLILLGAQELFLNMLDQAEKEVGFVTDDYRVMVEALALANGNFVLTVTRFEPDAGKGTYKRKRINIKRKTNAIDSKKAIYCFNNFDDFCEFCKFLDNSILCFINDFADSISLYQYKNKYYLVFTNINANVNILKSFCSCITEFAHFVDKADLFESKLLEYGKLLIKDNAVTTCIKHFC